MPAKAGQEKHATLTLDQLTRTSYGLSGRLGGRIFYEKMVLKAGTLTTFAWEHPAGRKAAMDAVIQHTINTLQPGGPGADQGCARASQRAALARVRPCGQPQRQPAVQLPAFDSFISFQWNA